MRQIVIGSFYGTEQAKTELPQRGGYMMKEKHFVITIERQYGSGGRLTGKRLADELGIHFYDEEILKVTSETSAIGEQYFRLADERAGNNLLYRIVTGMKPELTEPDKNGHKITSPENLFRFQSFFAPPSGYLPK